MGDHPLTVKSKKGRNALMMKRFITLLFFSSLLMMGSSVKAQESQPTTESSFLPLAVTLVGITSYTDYQEILEALRKCEGVRAVSLETEAPGLTALNLPYSGEVKDVITRISGSLPPKYLLTENSLPSGSKEIRIAKKQ